MDNHRLAVRPWTAGRQHRLPETRGERAVRPAHAGMSSLPHLYNVARAESMRGWVAELCQPGKMVGMVLSG